MRAFRHGISILAAVMVLAACGWVAPQSYSAENSACSMGCGMDMSSPSSCCCHMDQQSSSSIPAKVALKQAAPTFKGLFASALNVYFKTQLRSSFVPAAQARLPSLATELAFLGVFLI